MLFPIADVLTVNINQNVTVANCMFRDRPKLQVEV